MCVCNQNTSSFEMRKSLYMYYVCMCVVQCILLSHYHHIVLVHCSFIE